MPARVATPRLVLRCYEPADAPTLKASIDANLDHLLPWIPWAVNEPSTLEEVERRIIGFGEQFQTGPNWAFGVFLRHDERFIGGIGFHARIGPRALEIGYWLDASATGHGYMTEAVSRADSRGVCLSRGRSTRDPLRPGQRTERGNPAPNRIPARRDAREELDGLPRTAARHDGVGDDTRRFHDTQPRQGNRMTPPKEATGRELLRHTLATLAYRGGKALRGAPPEFSDYRVASGTRSPGEILAHIGDLLDWAGWLVRGEHRWAPIPPARWDEDVARFFSGLERLDDYLASDAPLERSTEELFQGPIADALAHVGQLTMLRRLAGYPVRGENYCEGRHRARPRRRGAGCVESGIRLKDQPAGRASDRASRRDPAGSLDSATRRSIL